MVDVETSGLSFVECEPLAIAIVPLDSTIEKLCVYVRPPRVSWSAVGREYFELYKAQWSENALAPAEACSKIVTYVQGAFDGPLTIIAHNVAFDLAFLRKLFHAAGVAESGAFSHRAIDTHTLLYALYLQGRIPASALSSTGAFEYFGVSVPDEVRHTAFGDALATRELFNRLLIELNIDRTFVAKSG